jgi:acyl carrier protein
MPKGSEEARAWLTQRLASALNIDRDELDPSEDVTRYGLDSLTGVEVATDLSEWLAHDLPDDLLWTNPSVNAVVAALAREGLCSPEQKRASDYP